MLPSPFTSRLVFLWTAVLGTGVAAGIIRYSEAWEQRISDLRADAQRSAFAFEAEKVARLTGGPVDRENPALKEVFTRLDALHAAFPEFASVKIFRIDPALGRAVFLTGRDFSQARREPLSNSEFEENAPKGLLTQSLPAAHVLNFPSGRLAVAYALIGERRVDSQATRDVVALSVATDHWRRELLEKAAIASFYVWALLGVPLGIVTLRRRQSRRETLLHQLLEAVQQSQSGILIVRVDGRIEFVNTGLCQQLGYEAEELIGRSCLEFRAPSLPREQADLMLREIRAGKSWEGEWSNARRNGGNYPARIMVSPVKGRNGQSLGFIAVVNDMTAHQRHQQEMRVAKEQAEAADRAKGQFLATMSHEVKTPVHGIVGFTTLLLDTSLNSEQREYVQTIRTSAEALVQLTGDILDFSRIESGGLQLEPLLCNLRATVEDALDIFAAAAADKKIELLHWIDPDVPVQVVLDGGRLRQVLVNLVGNAIKFTPRGEVEVQVRVLTGKAASIAPFDLTQSTGQMVAEFDDGSLTFEFSVRDTGIGIASADRPKLFQPFSQLDVSNVRKYGGAGLGLAISRNLVRLMSGHIWLSSDPGHGSTFTFTVRARSAPAGEDAPPAKNELLDLQVGMAHLPAALRIELETLLGQAGAVVRDFDFSNPLEDTADFLLFDCTAVSAETLQASIKSAWWRPERMVGLVTPATNTATRQTLRPAFEILLNKPLHHRALIGLLARARQKTSANEAKVL